MKIHIKSKQGIYNVDKYTSTLIYLSTHYKSFTVNVDDFNCLAGGTHNFRTTQKEINDFYKTINPKIDTNHFDDEIEAMNAYYQELCEEAEEKYDYPEYDYSEYDYSEYSIHDDLDYYRKRCKQLEKELHELRFETNKITVVDDNDLPF